MATDAALSSTRLSSPTSFRAIQPGFERLGSDHAAPRHAHFSPYISIILKGGYDQAGYLGRVRLEPGDVLLQPVLDRHESLPTGRCGVHVLRLNCGPVPGLGGLYRPAGLDDVIRLAERDPRAASGLLAEGLAKTEARAVRHRDWEDLLAHDLRLGRYGVVRWAERHGLARETVARGFRRAYGASPRTFALELRARAAWLQIVETSTSLAAIAADAGYADQPHMTRAVAALTGRPPSAWRSPRPARDAP